MRDRRRLASAPHQRHCWCAASVEISAEDGGGTAPDEGRRWDEGKEGVEHGRVTGGERCQLCAVLDEEGARLGEEDRGGGDRTAAAKEGALIYRKMRRRRRWGGSAGGGGTGEVIGSGINSRPR